MPRASLLCIVFAALAAALAVGDAAVAGTPKPRGAASGKAAASKGRPARAKKKPAATETASAGSAKGKPGKSKKKKARLGEERRKRGGSRALPDPPRHREPSLAILPVAIRCPPEMVAVAGRVCVDRHEASLVDAATGSPLSPYYPPARELAEPILAAWTRARELAPAGSLEARMPIPALDPEPRVLRPLATSVAAALPSGYVPGHLAAEACSAAGKRLCRAAEWVTACRGEAQTPFPYGARYVQDACNVFREAHPSQTLHGSASHGHTDPRLNQVASELGPLLRPTGATPACVSRWGDDGVFDMVGNLDEWIDDPEGTFLGGFYARATRSGCDARIGGHPIRYFDYSTGVRCCRDPDP